MKFKKTMEIDQLIDAANDMLANPDMSQDSKSAICCLLETLLMSNKRYSGFQNIHWLETGANEWFTAGSKIPEIKNYLGPEYDRRYYK